MSPVALALAACAGPEVPVGSSPPEGATGSAGAALPDGRFRLRDTVDALGRDTSEILATEWEPPLPGAWGWPPCDEAQRAAVTVALGPLQTCNAAGGLVSAGYGPAQDCAAGCFYDQAVGRFADGTWVRVDDAVWRWLRAPQEEVLDALFVPWVTSGNAADLDQRRGGLEVVCRTREPVEPDATTPSRVARSVFSGDEDCFVTWKVGSRGAPTGHVVLMELGVTGTLWVKDDGFVDGSELRFAPGRVEIALHAEEGRGVTRRTVLARPPAPPPGPLCDPPSVRGALPARLDVCGPSDVVSALGVVIDGHLAHAMLLGDAPLDPAFESCVREQLSAVELTPPGCVALPVAKRVSGALQLRR